MWLLVRWGGRRHCRRGPCMTKAEFISGLWFRGTEAVGIPRVENVKWAQWLCHNKLWAQIMKAFVWHNMESTLPKVSVALVYDFEGKTWSHLWLGTIIDRTIQGREISGLELQHRKESSSWQKKLLGWLRWFCERITLEEGQDRAL